MKKIIAIFTLIFAAFITNAVDEKKRRPVIHPKLVKLAEDTFRNEGLEIAAGLIDEIWNKSVDAISNLDYGRIMLKFQHDLIAQVEIARAANRHNAQEDAAEETR